MSINTQLILWALSGLISWILVVIGDWYKGVDIEMTDMLVFPVFLALGPAIFILTLLLIADAYHVFDKRVLIKGRK